VSERLRVYLYCPFCVNRDFYGSLSDLECTMCGCRIDVHRNVLSEPPCKSCKTTRSHHTPDGKCLFAPCNWVNDGVAWEPTKPVKWPINPVKKWSNWWLLLGFAAGTALGLIQRILQ
jgi:hypothetical protein